MSGPSPVSTGGAGHAPVRAGPTGAAWYPSGIHALSDNVLPAAVVVLGAMLLVRFVHFAGARHRRALDADVRAVIEHGGVLPEATKRARAVSEAAEWAVVGVTFIVGVVWAVKLLGIPLTSLVAPATVAGVAIGFGAQQLVGDLLAGFFLFAERQFAFGDTVRLSVPGQATGITGTVEELTLRVTKLRTQQGELVVVPNSALRQVTNLSRDWSRAVVDVPVAASEDLERVTTVLRQVLADLKADPVWSERILGDPVVAGVETIEVGYVRLRLIARTQPGRQFEVGREIRLRVATALRLESVASPVFADGGEGGTA